MKTVKVRGVKFLRIFKIEGMVIYPFVLFAALNPPQEIDNHEHIHVQQIQRDGILRFYASYLLEYFSYRKKGLGHNLAYHSISYEKEAYENHNDLKYRVLPHRIASRG